MVKQGMSSPSSSIDSSGHPAFSASSSPYNRRRDLSTDLRLGLTINPSSNARDELSDWPPIKPLLRSTISANKSQQNRPTFFVKVYMEGIPIGRKLDLLANSGYDGLISTLSRMFRTTIILDLHLPQASSKKSYVLTYEDKEGDWMMVGDVPWELFLTSVKRLRITRADKC